MKIIKILICYKKLKNSVAQRLKVFQLELLYALGVYMHYWVIRLPREGGGGWKVTCLGSTTISGETLQKVASDLEVLLLV